MRLLGQRQVLQALPSCPSTGPSVPGTREKSPRATDIRPVGSSWNKRGSQRPGNVPRLINDSAARPGGLGPGSPGSQRGVLPSPPPQLLSLSSHLHLQVTFHAEAQAASAQNLGKMEPISPSALLLTQGGVTLSKDAGSPASASPPVKWDPPGGHGQAALKTKRNLCVQRGPVPQKVLSKDSCYH